MQYLIGSRGLTPIPKASLPILPNRIYHLGGSDSPDLVFVTEVTDTHISKHAYPYGDTAESRIERDIGEMLIRHATEVTIKRLERYVASERFTAPEWAVRQLADYRNLLAGKNTLAEVDRQDWCRRRALVRLKPGVDHSNFDRNDPWYYCERFGGVASTGTGAETIYHIDCYTQDVKRLEQDPYLELIEAQAPPY